MMEYIPYRNGCRKKGRKFCDPTLTLLYIVIFHKKLRLLILAPLLFRVSELKKTVAL